MDDPVEWGSLLIDKGCIVEAVIEPLAEKEEPIWGGFLVMGTRITHDASLRLHVKSLGCGDPQVARELSSAFNRKEGHIHLCPSSLCMDYGDDDFHVKRIRVYSVEGFTRDQEMAGRFRNDHWGTRGRRNRKTPPSSWPKAGAGVTLGCAQGEGEARRQTAWRAPQGIRGPWRWRRAERHRGGQTCYATRKASKGFSSTTPGKQLDQTAKVEVGNAATEDPTLGVRIASYFSIIVKPNLGTALGPTREMYHLSNCIDLLRKGELSRLGDVLAGRFISLHQSVLDGGWQAARHLEVMPYEEVSAAGTSVVLQARKHARVAAKALGADAPWGWRQNPKGRGGKGKYPAWNETEWQGQGKGKQKGPKGRGKGKGGWPGPYADADGEALKKKEKPGEK